MYCKYCVVYRKTDKRRTENQSSSRVHLRHCPVKKAFVQKEDDSCKEFERNDIFWCERENQWRHFKDCLRRIKEKEDCSSRCRQKKEIQEIIKKEYFKEKRKQRAKENKPTLKRRR